MRNYLSEIEIVGAVLCFQEREQCHWSLDWLYANCDRVAIVFDNYDKETEEFVLTNYRDKYPDRTRIAYSDNPVDSNRIHLAGQIKRRFKLNQHVIREQAIKLVRQMHEEKPIDLLIWPDSDECFIDEFPKYLERFWYRIDRPYMTLGFVQPFDSFRILVSQEMSPHGRVWKYRPDMTALPYTTRTRHHPYLDYRAWKVRHVVVHTATLTEEYRRRREFFDNKNFFDKKRDVWLLPKDVRQMTVEEISQYQGGAHGAPSLIPSIPLEEFINNKEKYKEYLT